MKNIGIWLCLLTVFSACQSVPKKPFGQQTAPAPPDYSQTSAWAALPTKDDPADRVPDASFNDQQASALVDVFFLHPTTYTHKKGNTQWNADINDTETNKRTDETTILHQASIFNGAGKVYAPRYRQAHLQAYYESDDKRNADRALDLAYTDVKAAFQYYLKNYNNDRPIIIASHSQGTTHAKRLLREFFDGKPLQSQLVAAYLVGIPVYATDLQHIPVCEQAADTGCFVSWRTYREDFTVPDKLADTTTVVAVNPLSWKTDGTFVPKTENKGAVLRKYQDDVHPELVSAQLRAGAVFTNRPKFPWSFLLTTQNYHIADYNFFWVNVRENAQERVEAYLSDE